LSILPNQLTLERWTDASWVQQSLV